MRDLPIEDYCYYQSPIGLIRMGETGGFLTRADFVEKSPESKHIQPDSVSNSSTLLKDACNYPFKFFLVQTFNRSYIAKDQVLVANAETYAF